MGKGGFSWTISVFRREGGSRAAATRAWRTGNRWSGLPAGRADTPVRLYKDRTPVLKVKYTCGAAIIDKFGVLYRISGIKSWILIGRSGQSEWGDTGGLKAIR
jgi:hypothetical protein